MMCIVSVSFHHYTLCMQGCTIYKQGEAVFVGKLLKGCDAELSGKSPLCPVGWSQIPLLPPFSFSPPVSAEVLREGDEVLEVNGVPVMGRSTDEIVRLMVSWYIATCLVCAYAVCREMCFLSFFLSFFLARIFMGQCAIHTPEMQMLCKWLIKAPKEGL